MKLNDSIAIVTGAASGIGLATAQALAQAGATVVLGDIADDKGEQAAAAIRAAGHRAEYLRCDVTDAASVNAFRDAVLARHGRVDIVANVAGWGKIQPFLENDDAFIERVVDLNFMGTLRVVRAFLPAMIERKHGKIVNVSSDAGRVGSTGETVYSGAKGGVIAFTKGLARETGKAAGGPKVVAEMMKHADKATEGRIFDDLEQRDPELAGSIRAMLFTFEDCLQFDNRSMQTLLKEVAREDLLLALKTASPALSEKIFANVSSRAAEILREDLSSSGPARLKDVEAAQQRIVAAVRDLEADGKLVVAGGASGDVLV